MATKRNYQGLIDRISEIVLANPIINSVDAGRELEFDVKKKNLFPRGFIRTNTSTLIGGPGSNQIIFSMSLLVLDRVKTDRSNIIDALNTTYQAMGDTLATLHKEQIIRFSDNPTIEPLYDYHDAQAAGWSVTLQIYGDMILKCYPVP